jgi:hypothetical protein
MQYSDLTVQDINRKVELLNRLSGFPDGFKGYTTPGFFRTLSDYGGMKLVRVINYAGGVRAVIQGYQHPDVLLTKLDGFIAGWHEGKMTLEEYKNIADDYEKRGNLVSAPSGDEAAERKFLQPLNPDPIAALAKTLRGGKR